MIYLGVEYGAVYHLEGPNGQKAVFNDDTDPDFVGDLDPESSGLDGAEIREDSNDRVESDGAIFGDFFSGKRPIVLQGSIIANSKSQRNERVGKLRAASLAKTEDATLWWEDAAAGKVFTNVRRQQPLRVTKGWQKEFQLALVAADSRILSYNTKVVSDTGLTFSTQEKLPSNVGTYLLAGQSEAEVVAWTNPTNIKLSDNVYATATLSAGKLGTQVIYGNTYGFTIPTGAIITYVEVGPEAHASVNAGAKTLLEVISATVAQPSVVSQQINARQGTAIGGLNATFLPLTTSDTTIWNGGKAASYWNYASTLVPAVVNNGEFGAALEYAGTSGTTISLDKLSVRITYINAMEVIANNEGSAPAPAVIKVKGPIKNFYIRNEATGEIIYYGGELASGKELWFDTESTTVTEFGEGGEGTPVNRFANVGLPNDWIKIAPGSNTILCGGEGGSAASGLTVEYRDAWE